MYVLVSYYYNIRMAGIHYMSSMYAIFIIPVTLTLTMCNNHNAAFSANSKTQKSLCIIRMCSKENVYDGKKIQN